MQAEQSIRRFKLVTRVTRTNPDIYLLETTCPEKNFQDAKSCPACRREFGMFRRKYHCAADGVIFCDDCMPKNDAHGTARICKACLSALQAKNQEAKDDMTRILRLGEDATRQLGQIDDVVHNSRLEIVSQEEELFDLLVDYFAQSATRAKERERQRYASMENGRTSGSSRSGVWDAADNDDFGAGGGGGNGGPDKSRRRTRAIFGIRSGVLTVRVHGLKRLPPVKADGMLSPFAIIEAGVQQRTSARAVLDATSIAKLAEHRRYMLPAMTNTGNENATTRAEDDASPLDNTVTIVAFDFTDENGAAMKDRDPPLLNFVLEDTFVFYIKDDRAGIRVVIIDDTTIPNVPTFLGVAYINLRKLNVLVEDATRKDFERAQQAVTKARAAGSSLSALSGAAPLLESPAERDNQAAKASFDPESFENYVERAKQSRVLNFETGQRNGDAEVVVSYTFHPQRQQFSPASHDEEAPPLKCEGCDQNDTPATCVCSETTKLQLSEDYLKAQLRQVAGELRAKELEAKRWRNDALEKGTSHEPLNPFANLKIPRLHSGKRNKIETCCC